MPSADPHPTAITVRVLGSAERDVLDRVAPDVFDHPVHRRWSEEFFADPRHHLAVALAEEADGPRVVGMASAVHYVHPDKPPELWINEVGVAPTHHRLGLGKRLLQALFQKARELGCAEAWVLTEGDNTAARRLYASVGGEESAERPVYFTFSLTNPTGPVP